MPRAFVDTMRCAATVAGLMRVTAFSLGPASGFNDGRCTDATITRRSPGLAQSRSNGWVWRTTLVSGHKATYASETPFNFILPPRSPFALD